MFKTLSKGFKSGVKAFTDRRIPLEGYPKVDDYREMFWEYLKNVDAALIIAPESGMEYYNLVLELEKAGCANLGSSSEAVWDTTDKYVTFRKLKKVRKPKTWIHKGNTTSNFPLVAKPRDGVSCEGLFLVEDERDLERVPRGYLLQEYIPGGHYSASLLVGDEITVLSVNTQEMENFVYKGAIVPAPLELSPDEEEELIKAMESFKGLKGYVGIDFIYNEGVVVIEINARPTTPIIAMEEAYGYNPSEVILKNHLGIRVQKPRSRRRVIMRKHSPCSKGDVGEVFVEFGGYSISLNVEKPESCSL
jgi:hypothetical protein